MNKFQIAEINSAAFLQLLPEKPHTLQTCVEISVPRNFTVASFAHS